MIVEDILHQFSITNDLSSDSVIEMHTDPVAKAEVRRFMNELVVVLKENPSQVGATRALRFLGKRLSEHFEEEFYVRLYKEIPSVLSKKTRRDHFFRKVMKVVYHILNAVAGSA